jgi:hypothetical protein
MRILRSRCNFTHAYGKPKALLFYNANLTIINMQLYTNDHRPKALLFNKGEKKKANAKQNGGGGGKSLAASLLPDGSEYASSSSVTTKRRSVAQQRKDEAAVANEAEMAELREASIKAYQEMERRRKQNGRV